MHNAIFSCEVILGLDLWVSPLIYYLSRQYYEI
jgi:hypothetical protein